MRRRGPVIAIIVLALASAACAGTGGLGSRSTTVFAVTCADSDLDLSQLGGGGSPASGRSGRGHHRLGRSSEAITNLADYLEMAAIGYWRSGLLPRCWCRLRLLALSSPRRSW